MIETMLKDRIETALRNEIAPRFGLDGSLIEVLDLDRGCLVLRMNGACAS